jgi:hypothetical protein
MAIKIPKYDRHVNLDAAAQTIPRVTTNDAIGRGLKEVGHAMSALGRHLEARQEQLENHKYAELLAQQRQKAALIEHEEMQNYVPGQDEPGTVHNRVKERVQQIVSADAGRVPPRLLERYKDHSVTFVDGHSTRAAIAESAIDRQFYTKDADKTAGELARAVKNNPDGFEDAHRVLKQKVDGMVNVPARVRGAMMDGYTKTLIRNAAEGYSDQGRHEDGIDFVKKTVPRFDIAPQQPAPGPRSEGGGLVNEKQAGATRNWPVTDTLKRQIAHAAEVSGVEVDVFSGGQPSRGPNRVGGHRHDGGEAADVYLYTTQGGRRERVTPDTPQGRQIIANFITAARAEGATGIGHGPGYMGGTGIHVGGGSAAVWGAGGSVKTAPAWVKEAYVRGSMKAPRQAQAEEAPADKPVQVADASGRIIGGMRTGPVTPVTPSAAAPARVVTPWSSMADGLIADLTADKTKREGKDVLMKAKLKSVLESDVLSIQNTGKNVKLSPELAAYFKSDDLTLAVVERHLGQGAAITWEDDRQLARRVYGATGDMKTLPIDAMWDRVDALAPTGGEQDYKRQKDIYDKVHKVAAKHHEDRLSDPAAAADAFPEVKALLDRLKANPEDLEAGKQLAQARMDAQKVLGIPDGMRTPITVREARAIAAPLLNVAEPNAAAATRTVLAGIETMAGGDRELMERALGTVLRVKGFEKDKEQALTDAFIKAGQPAPPPVVPAKDTPADDDYKKKWGDWRPARMTNERPVPPGDANAPLTGGPETLKNDDGAQLRGFVPSAHIKGLRNGSITDEDFNITYGAVQGVPAAQYYKGLDPYAPSYDEKPPPEEDLYSDHITSMSPE